MLEEPTMSHRHYQGNSGGEAPRQGSSSDTVSTAVEQQCTVQRKNDMCSISYIYYVIDITACLGQRTHYYIHSLKSDASPLGAHY